MAESADMRPKEGEREESTFVKTTMEVKREFKLIISHLFLTPWVLLII